MRKEVFAGFLDGVVLEHFLAMLNTLRFSVQPSEPKEK